MQIYYPKHPSTSNGHVYEHRLVVEEYLSSLMGIKVYLDRFMNVHHKNGNRQDNRIENLELTTVDLHGKYHGKNNYN